MPMFREKFDRLLTSLADIFEEEERDIRKGLFSIGNFDDLIVLLMSYKQIGVSFKEAIQMNKSSMEANEQHQQIKLQAKQMWERHSHFN